MFPHIVHYYRQENEIYEIYSLLPTTVTVIKKSTNSQCWRGPAEKGTLLCQCWEWKLLQSLRSTEWMFLKILKVQISCDPAIPHSGYIQINLWLEKAHGPQPTLRYYFKANLGGNQKVLGEMKGKSRCGTHKQRNVTQPPNRREQCHLQQQRWTSPWSQ